MNVNINESLLLILIVLIATSLLAFKSEESTKLTHPITETDETDELKALAFQVLKTKCNTCHIKQNPFFIFTKKNMEKRAERINRAVYIEKRMPKADGEKLTQEESYILKRWLETKNL
ncbi:MAG: hypothetical protein CMP59_10270 [Flavobacteriales bacterium]|nr:hypothetical protein [Flavobacteriales bacterium]